MLCNFLKIMLLKYHICGFSKKVGIFHIFIIYFFVFLQSSWQLTPIRFSKLDNRFQYSRVVSFFNLSFSIVFQIPPNNHGIKPIVLIGEQGKVVLLFIRFRRNILVSAAVCLRRCSRIFFCSGHLVYRNKKR